MESSCSVFRSPNETRIVNRCNMQVMCLIFFSLQLLDLAYSRL